MNYQNTYPTNHSDKSYKIGSFSLDQRFVDQMQAALGIAKTMRGPNDGEIEDAARAFLMLHGMSYCQFDSLDVVSYGAEEAERQLVSYDLGIRKLEGLFPFDEERDIYTH
jgi:hypothetical protein